MIQGDAIRSRPEGRIWLVICLVYFVLSAVLISLPLVGILHAESSAIIAGAAFFLSGFAILSDNRPDAPPGRLLVRCLACSLVPLGMLTFSLIWRPNCGYLLGLCLYAVFVFPSVILGASMGSWCRSHFKLRRTIFLSGGLALLVLPIIYDVGFHPQFYTYNHVFGAVLGPVYDEELTVRAGLFVFRALSLLWALLFWLSDQSIERNSTLPHLSGRRAQILVVATIIAVYALGHSFGFNVTRTTIESELSDSFATAHFETHYSSGEFDAAEVEFIARTQEFRFDQLHEALAVEPGEAIQVYLYPDAEAKGRLTGARTTSITPVWLGVPQIHMLASEFSSSFSHELVHVFSREFGVPFLRASLSVGLVEGLAVALEAPDGLPGPDEQVAASLLESGRTAQDLAASTAASMTPFGFWTGRGAVSYTVAGSFCSFLLSSLGVTRFKELYRSGFTPGGSIDLHDLAEDWAVNLGANIHPDSAAIDLASARFSQPSLFERRCPHFVSSEERALRKAERLMSDGDTLGARVVLERYSATSLAARYQLAVISMAESNFERAQELIPDSTKFLALDLLRIDADVASTSGGEAMERATIDYLSVLDRIPAFARGARTAVALRLSAVDGRTSASSVSYFYGSGLRDCDLAATSTELWSCARTRSTTKDYTGAAEFIGRIAVPEIADPSIRKDVQLFLLTQQADWLSVAGQYGSAMEVYQKARAIAARWHQPEMLRLLDDKLEFVSVSAERNTPILTGVEAN